MMMREIAIAIFILLLYPIFANYGNTIKRHSKQKYFYVFTFIIFFSFAAFRPIGIDQDSVGYESYYNSGDVIWLLAEPTFVIISQFVQKIFDDFRLVLIIYALIGIGIKFLILPKLCSTLWLSVLLYFTTFFLLHEFTQIRAGVASGLFLVAIYYLEKKCWRSYVIIVLLACLFHYSAVILLPLVFLMNIKGKKICLIVLASLIPMGLFVKGLGAPILSSIPIELIQRKTEIYSIEAENAHTSLNIFNLVYLSKYAVLYYFIFKAKKYRELSTYFPILLSVYAISLFLYIGLSWNTIYAMRTSELLGIVEIVLIPMIYRGFKNRIIGKCVVIGIAFAYLITNIYSLELIYEQVKI